MKSINLTTIDDIQAFINFNAYSNEGFYPAQITFKGKARGNGVWENVNAQQTLGTPRENPFSPKELYQRISAALGQDVANAFKALYLAGINEDVSD